MLQQVSELSGVSLDGIDYDTLDNDGVKTFQKDGLSIFPRMFM